MATLVCNFFLQYIIIFILLVDLTGWSRS